MLTITDNVLLEYLQVNKKHKLDEVFSLKKYTVSDTELSYRQANSLDESNLLDNDRKDNAKWRKFSYKDLVYLTIVQTLREFGVKNEQLTLLWESFFKEPAKDLKKRQLEWANKSDAEIAIGCVWGGYEITFIFDAKGLVTFSDPIHLMLSQNTKPYIRITLNEIINRVNGAIGLAPLTVEYNLQSLVLNHLSATTPKEKELLTIIREKQYSVIKVKKKGGEIATVYAEKNKDQNDITPKDLEKLLEANDYIDITIVKRDGKIVSYKSEETIKL